MLLNVTHTLDKIYAVAQNIKEQKNLIILSMLTGRTN